MSVTQHFITTQGQNMRLPQGSRPDSTFDPRSRIA